jgi:hypothetical protein
MRTVDDDASAFAAGAASRAESGSAAAAAARRDAPSRGWGGLAAADYWRPVENPRRPGPCSWIRKGGWRRGAGPPAAALAFFFLGEGRTQIRKWGAT